MIPVASCAEYGTCTPTIFSRLFKIDNKEQKEISSCTIGDLVEKCHTLQTGLKQVTSDISFKMKFQPGLKQQACCVLFIADLQIWQFEIPLFLPL